MKPRGLSFLSLSIPLLLSLPGFSFAATLFKSDGLTNNKTYDDKSFITNACLSNLFSNNAFNVYNSSVLSYYQGWTQLHLRKHLASGSINEIEAAGTHLFGVPNFECLWTTGHCTPQPTCESIAKFMGLRDEIEPTPEEVTELQKRYFLSQVFENDIRFPSTLWNAIALGKEDLVDIVDEIAVTFATQADRKAMDTCAFQRFLGQSAVFTVAGVVAFATAFIAISAAPGDAAMLFAGGVVTAQSVVSNGITNTVFAASGWMNNIGLYDPQLAVPLDAYSDGKRIQTPMDTSRCANSLGQMGDTNNLYEHGVRNSIDGEIERMRVNMADRAYKNFHKTSFPLDNETYAGPSAFAIDLTNNPSWVLALAGGDDLQGLLRQEITARMARSLIGLVLRSRQCYAKCLQLDPKLGMDDPKGIRINEESTIDLLLSTFYPEQVIAKENTTFTPTLQCQFQCLKQNDEGDPYIPLEMLQNLMKWQHPKMDHFELFNEAVIAHLQGSGQFEVMPEIKDRIPSFEIPVCISSNMLLEDANLDYNQHGKQDWNEGWTDWRNNTRAYFPFHCGDWKANETRNFIGEMPIGSSVDNFKKMEDFWWYSLKHNIKIHGERPLTHFLTLCEVGQVMSFPDDEWLGTDSERICESVQDLTKEMSELEGNLFFCYGMHDLLHGKIDVNEKENPRDKVPWIDHKELCKSLSKTPEDSKSLDPVGLDNATFVAIATEYVQQRAEWMNGGPITFNQFLDVLEEKLQLVLIDRKEPDEELGVNALEEMRLKYFEPDITPLDCEILILQHLHKNPKIRFLSLPPFKWNPTIPEAVNFKTIPEYPPHLIGLVPPEKPESIPGWINTEPASTSTPSTSSTSTQSKTAKGPKTTSARPLHTSSIKSDVSSISPSSTSLRKVYELTETMFPHASSTTSTSYPG